MAFAINIHINLFLLGWCGKFPFSAFAFLFHFLLLGFCLLVAFVLLVKGLFIFAFTETISRRCIVFLPPLVSHCFFCSFGIVFRVYKKRVDR